MMLLNLRRLLRRERPRAMFAIRGALAALAALTVVVLLKLECPFWAAMTAIIVVQPTRGLLLESGGEHGSPGRVAAEAMGDAAALFHGNVVLWRGQGAT